MGDDEQGADNTPAPALTDYALTADEMSAGVRFTSYEFRDNDWSQGTDDGNGMTPYTALRGTRDQCIALEHRAANLSVVYVNPPTAAGYRRHLYLAGAVVRVGGGVIYLPDGACQRDGGD
jgi:hypothetical protein